MSLRKIEIDELPNIPFERLFDLMYRLVQPQEGFIELRGAQSDYKGGNFNPVYNIKIYVKRRMSEHALLGEGRSPSAALVQAATQVLKLEHMNLYE